MFYGSKNKIRKGFLSNRKVVVYNKNKEKKMTLRKILIMVENDVAGEMIFEDSFSYNQKM